VDGRHFQERKTTAVRHKCCAAALIMQSVGALFNQWTAELERVGLLLEAHG